TVLAQVLTIVEREGSIGLIAPDALVPALGAVLAAAGLGYALLGAPENAEHEFEQHLDLVPATLAKGLEFDHVLLAEPSAIVAAEPDRVTGLRRLYVCLTRAVTSLVVIHQAPLPDELGGSTSAQHTHIAAAQSRAALFAVEHGLVSSLRDVAAAP